MNKKHLHHVWRLIRPIGFGYLLVLAVAFFVIFIFANRNNNLVMLDLRQKVFVADEENGDVELALKNLREHVYAHMNTDLSSGANAVKPPIQLKFRYERLVAAERARFEQANTELAKKAQTACGSTRPEGQNTAVRACIQNFVLTHGTTVQSIPDSLYKFDFVSPRWSPDLAGWSFVAAIVFLGLAIVRIVLEATVHMTLKRHQ